MHLLVAFDKALKNTGSGGIVGDAKAFSRLAGTARLPAALGRNQEAPAIIEAWTGEVDAFVSKRQRHLLY